MIPNHEYTISSLDELDNFTRNEFLKFLKPSDDGATLINLKGDLGAGKTAFTKSVAKAFGIEEHITSPTFIIAKSYTLPGVNLSPEEFESPQEFRAHPHFNELVHIDAYRMENPEEASVLRLPEMLRDPRKIILIEWPEQLEGELPKPNMNLELRFINETTRGITWKE